MKDLDKERTMSRPGLGTIEVALENGVVTLDLDEMVPIGDDISTEFREQPSLYAYVAMLSADAESLWRESKRLMDEAYAEADKAVRDELLSLDVRITEKKVESEVESRRGYCEAVRYELDCRKQYLIMRALQDSMEMRANMLISLGAHLREEAKQTGMLIMETKKKLRELKGE